MKTYKQVLETVELALIKGEYHFCIEYLSPIIENFPPSTKEGVNLRTLIITALCVVNKKNESKTFCKELLRSDDYKTKENARYLMEIIDSPEIKKPDNWNVKFENNMNSSKTALNSIKPNNKLKENKKFIDTSNIPTGETKPFQKGFVFVIFLLLILLIPMLSGCVKIENTLDLREIDSINNNFTVESKYIKKSPWQINFEKRIKDIIPYSKILIGDISTSITNNNLSFEDTKDILYKIQRTAFEFTGGSTDLKINSIVKNFFFLKKYNYKIDLDLQTLSYNKDLELNFNIINPNKVIVRDKNNPQLEVSKNKIRWNLIPGEINVLEFSFWNWNKLFLGFMFITFIILLAYFIRFYRYQIGSDLPKLPSD